MSRLPDLILASSLTFFLSCSESVHIPDGDAEAGRSVFSRLECHACHRVHGEEDLPRPTAEPAVPVVLGNPFNRKDKAYLFESILSPSHRFAKPSAMTFGEFPLRPDQIEYPDIRQGQASRMGDFTRSMTVQELLDLVAYLDAQQEKTSFDSR